VLRWRNQEDLPVPTQHICSPYDPEARWANKGSRTWVGYKVFFTETCDPDQPRLITHVATTPANTADETLVKPIHAHLEEAGLLPSEHLMDAGYNGSRISDTGIRMTKV
jgi:transposase